MYRINSMHSKSDVIFWPDTILKMRVEIVSFIRNSEFKFLTLIYSFMITTYLIFLHFMNGI